MQRVLAYVAAEVADGVLGEAEAEDLRFVLSKAGQGVMNPSSLGASTINLRVEQALRCFGLVGPARSRLPPPPATRPSPPQVSSRLHFFRTCGDHLCSGYRGPTPGVPRCGGAKAGDPCTTPGARCDLVNGCNMHLICAAKDPSTRCPR